MNGVGGGADAARAEAGWSSTRVAAERFVGVDQADCDGDDVFGGAADDVGQSFQSGDARVAAAAAGLEVEQLQAVLLCAPDRAEQAVELDFGSSSYSLAWSSWPSPEVSLPMPGSYPGPSKPQQHSRPSRFDSSHLNKRQTKY